MAPLCRQGLGCAGTAAVVWVIRRAVRTSPMIGITATGSTSRVRLDRSLIARAWSTSQPPRDCVANYDEDALTMATDARSGVC